MSGITKTSGATAMRDEFLVEAERFVSFVNNAPSPFHAVDQVRKKLLKENFVELKEKSRWDSSTVKPFGIHVVKLIKEA
ncbi:Aspartyl aminopeptidase [Zancudomyces culisetae]|uniref:Aspartyl aminopeptidase n=1 Tax=Zancudomyces culisetae TaxID=1213189 RepID=A0A1R1PQ34_ZANCU|nr:Aspartyl aminopeptidase [Zancudomyces culisetae]|eukprot:OMH83074.1 Aspartyl aminopeptidase [Zancudomyces culisetae]